MLQANELTKYYNDSAAVDRVDLALAEGEMIGLVGPSGSGKSVLLKLLSGVVKPDYGSIKFDNDQRSTVGVLFQEGALFDSMSVLANVAFPLLEKGLNGRSVTKDEAYSSAYAALREVGLAAAYKKHPGQLSGGMRRRAGIARALVAKPKLVLLDDPTGGLDPVAASVILDLVCELQHSHDLTIISISHDIRRLLPKVQRVWVMMEGRMVCDMPTEQLCSNAPRVAIEFLSSRYDFPDAECAGDGANG